MESRGKIVKQGKGGETQEIGKEWKLGGKQESTKKQGKNRKMGKIGNKKKNGKQGKNVKQGKNRKIRKQEKSDSNLNKNSIPLLLQDVMGKTKIRIFQLYYYRKLWKKGK